MEKDGITEKDMVPVYFSPDPYYQAFDERLDMRRYDAYNKPAGGMVFAIADDRLTLWDILPSSPTAKVPVCRTRILGTWLHKVGATPVTTEKEVVTALTALSVENATHCTLVFLHPEVSQGLTNTGIPQINLDPMNPCRMMSPSFCSAMMIGAIGGSFIPDRPHNGFILVKESGEVLNYVSKVMKLTRRKLQRGKE